MGEERTSEEEGQKQFPIMEEKKGQTETRKQRSQVLEKTARLKKKSQISEKKEQKAEVRRKIEDSLPIGPPDKAFRCSSCTTEYCWWRGWWCLDHEKHQREWMVKERRVMVKDAFQEQAKAASGFSKVRKLGAVKKFAFSSSDDFDDDSFSEEECSDTEDPVWQKPTEIFQDLSAFLVKKRGDKRPRKQTIRISPDQFQKPRPVVVESEKNVEEENRRIPSELCNLLEKLEEEEDEEADEEERKLYRSHRKHIADLPWLLHCSQALSHFLPALQAGSAERQLQYVLLPTDSFSSVCPASWSRAYGATFPPTMMLEHKERDLTLMVAEVGKRHHVSVCLVTLITDSSSGARVFLNLPKHRLLTLSNLCQVASEVEAALREKKASLTTQVAQLEARKVHHGESSWSMVDHQEEPWENSFGPPSNSFCGICLERTHLPLALAGCGHIFCHQCWSRYLVASVRDDVTLPLRCPETCCSQPVDLVTAAFILTRHQSHFPSWQTFLELSIKALPFHSCHRCHRPSYLSDRTHCPCGELRCLACGLRDHWPASCADFALSLQLAKEDLSTSRLEVLVRTCPRCHECWEKSYGCNHMFCTLCRTSFCWGCGKEGSKHGVYCGDMESPLETKVVYTSGLFGLSSERLGAIEVGLKKVNQPTLSGNPQARRVARGGRQISAGALLQAHKAGQQQPPPPSLRRQG